MLNEERQRAILDLLRRDGRVLVVDLAKHFHTSQVTIRKDLETLHLKGSIHRTHGGGLPARDGALEGQVVVLDSGTTTTAIARALRNFQKLTIITNAVNIAAELSGSALEVILTGGSLRKNSFSLVGPIAEETIRKLYADILFLGVDGFDVQYGFSTPNLLESKVNRAMIEISRVAVAVCDSSKFGRRSLSLIAPASALQHVITDSGIQKADLSALRKSGAEVTVV
jgi:DeoR family transcriptional regulator of aga operon